MKKFKRKAITLALCGIIAAGITTGAFLIFGEKEAQSAVVSAGLQQFADGAYLACAAPAGQSISFTAEWFDQTLQGEPVSSITVTALPPVTEGTLQLGHTEMTLGQTVQRENLSYLSFIPRDGVKKSSFEFVPTTLSGESGYSLLCNLSVTEAVNCCPTGTKSITAVSTHASLSLNGTLTAEDPEGEKLYFEVVSYPSGGTVSLNHTTGAFSYLPANDFSGEDSFTWRVQDERGAFSDIATVNITVRELTTDQLFTDVADTNVQSAALRMAEKDLMGGEAVGGKHYFHPDRALTRGAFVAILLKAAEVEFPEADSTGYEDDASIPSGLKGAIRYAREQNWLGDDTSFRPHDPITRAEAAKIAAAVLGLSAPGYHETVEDFETIPVSVVDALYAIYEGGYISTLADGTLAPMGELTRGDAAKFFAKILDGKSE